MGAWTHLKKPPFNPPNASYTRFRSEAFTLMEAAGNPQNENEISRLTCLRETEDSFRGSTQSLQCRPWLMNQKNQWSS